MLASSASDPTGLLDRLRAALEGEFRILRELGRGGMGRVFLAHEVALDRRVAMKVLPPAFSEHRDIVERFKREARTAGKLSHPHIVPVFQVSEREGLTFFTMPYIAGPSLRDVLRRTPRLDVALACRYLREAAEALGYAHGQGIIHRDIKPENMLLEGSRDGRLLLTDFGIAKALGAGTTLTQPGEMIGTPYYMSPEQCQEREDIDGRTDQYSLGLVAYEMLAGRFPFTADTMAAIVFKHLNEDPEPLERLRGDVPEDLHAIIARATRKSPGERFTSMYDLREALDPLRTRIEHGDRKARSGRVARPVGRSSGKVAQAAGRAVDARPGGAATGGRTSASAPHAEPGSAVRRRALLGAAAVVLLSAVAGIGAWMMKNAGEQEGGRLAELRIGPTSPDPVAATEMDSTAVVEGLAVAAMFEEAARDTNSTSGSERIGPAPGTPDRSVASGVPAVGRVTDDRSDGRPADADEDRSAGGKGGPAATGPLTPQPAARDTVPGEDAEERIEQDVPAGPTEDVAPEVDAPDAGADRPQEEPAPPPEERIGELLEDYRRAVEAREIGQLAGQVYGTPIPQADERIYRLWFSTTEDLRIDLNLRDLEIVNETARARVEQRMTYRLSRTGELRSNQRFEFEMRFQLTPDGWRLVRIQPR